MSTLYDMRSGTLVKSKPYTNGLFLKDVINSNTTTPSILSVIDYLLKGGGESAVAYAIYELTDGATDWVLDPENNQVKYTQSTGGGSWTPQVMCTGNGTKLRGTVSEVANAECAHYGWGTFSGEIRESGSSIYARCMPANVNVTLNDCTLDDTPPPEPEEKYIPIDTVAAKVIANAEAGHAPSQEAVNNSVKI